MKFGDVTRVFGTICFETKGSENCILSKSLIFGNSFQYIMCLVYAQGAIQNVFEFFVSHPNKNYTFNAWVQNMKLKERFALVEHEHFVCCMNAFREGFEKNIVFLGVLHGKFLQN